MKVTSFSALLLHIALVAAAKYDPGKGPSRNPSQGINCLGSSQCSPIFNSLNSENLIALMNVTIWALIKDDALFPAHQQIACATNAAWAVGGFCLFIQGKNVPSDGVPGAVLKARIHDLAYHGCKYCGSVPVSGDNNPWKAGILTSNYVLSPGCAGICFYGLSPPRTTPSTTLAAGNNGTFVQRREEPFPTSTRQSVVPPLQASLVRSLSG